jgi:PadR family transcriptional regulator PadR
VNWDAQFIFAGRRVHTFSKSHRVRKLYFVETTMAGRAGYLGEFEQVVLLAVARLGDEAYGENVRREIQKRTGRAVTVGAAYATLNRLVDKRYARAAIRQPHWARDKRARRIFALTPAGIEALEAARALHVRMWAGVHLQRSRR